MQIKLLLTIVLAATAILILPGFKKMKTQPMQARPIAEDTNRVSSKDPLPVSKDATDMYNARLWLKSIGYDLDYDQMKALKQLSLQKYSIEIQKNVTDANMRHVTVLTNLETLRLSRKIGDQGLQHLAGMTNLTTLNMPDSKVTDNGLQHLRNLTRLNNLVMPNMNITDAGVAHIKHLNLSILNLTRTKITDAGVDMLKDMPLQRLSISFTDISDASIPTLSQMRSLERLDIQGRDGISQQGYEQLKTALPNTQIMYP